MTLKTLKPKQNNSLILDDEFIRYCELNKIDDIQKLAKETFNKGFVILKYGETPNINLKPKPVNVDTIEVIKETIIPNTPLKMEKSDLYGE